MKKFKGTGVSQGIAIGPVCFINKIETDKEITKKDEITKFKEALEITKKEISEFKNHIRGISKDEGEIFEAHLLLLEDPMLTDGVEAKITSGSFSARKAVEETISELAKLLEDLKDEYIRARSADIYDIGKRILAHLSGLSICLSPGSIMACKESFPSEVAIAHSTGLSGIICEEGTLNSHASILARALGIPVVFVKDIIKELNVNETVILDGLNGEVITGADEKTIGEYRNKNTSEEISKEFKSLKNILKQEEIIIKANIANSEEAEKAFKEGAHGIGVVRTEFLFISRDIMPDEEEQYRVYSNIVKAAGNKSVTIRTLDGGSDKPISYLNLPSEPNPSLGLRGLRISLKMPHIFKTQIRAILRSSEFGNVQILLPMVTNIDELKKARKLISEVSDELQREKIYHKKVPLGVMIEVPSAAICGEEFAKESDFMSIGTNDLVQYTLAVDRINPNIVELYNELDSAVLNLIKMVVEGGKKYNCPVSVCGEMAGNLKTLPHLLRLGIREISVNYNSISKIRKAISF